MSPFSIAGIVARDGIVGLYRGFVPNALKTLPNSRCSFLIAIAFLGVSLHLDYHICVAK